MVNGVVGLILLGIIIFGGLAIAIISIVQSIHSNSYKEIKVLVKQNKNIDPWLLDHCSVREKSKVNKLFEKHNYKLVEIEINKPRVVYGCGKITFADGSCQYQIHFSKNCFSEIDKKNYDSLKKELGNEVNFIHKEKIYTNKGENV